MLAHISKYGLGLVFRLTKGMLFGSSGKSVAFEQEVPVSARSILRT
jgi:hypothetical protein